MNRPIQSEYEEFLKYEKIAITIAIASIIVGFIFHLFKQTFIGFTLASVVVTLSLSYRNWSYFSNLDEVEITRVESILDAIPILLFVWIFSGLYLFYYVKDTNNLFMLLSIISMIWLFEVMVNIWYPRYARKKLLLKTSPKTSIEETYNESRQKLYDMIGGNIQKIDEFDQVIDSSDGKMKSMLDIQLIMVKLLEAQSISTWHNISRSEGAKADKLTFSVVIAALSPAFTGIIYPFVANVMSILFDNKWIN